MSRRVVWAAAVAALAAAAVVVLALGGHRPPSVPPSTHRPTWPPLRTARLFFFEELREKVDGEWSAAWQTLYPAHRRVVTRQEFVACERARPFPAALRSLRILRVRKALVRVPGRARLVAGVALDVHVELAWYGPRDPIVFTYTFHVVPVHGHWAWLLSRSRFRLYARDGCLTQLAV
jgi:hypothetical protein